MSDIGGTGTLGSDPFAAANLRNDPDLVTQLRQVQDAVTDRARDALLDSGGRTQAEIRRDRILSEAGPGIRRENVAQQGDSPRLRQISDDTAELDAAQRRAADDAGDAGTVARTPARDQVDLSDEAQRRLAAENSAPAPGAVPQPERDDPLTVDTAQERQQAELGNPVDSGGLESQGSRELGRILDQFS